MEIIVGHPRMWDLKKLPYLLFKTKINKHNINKRSHAYDIRPSSSSVWYIYKKTLYNSSNWQLYSLMRRLAFGTVIMFCGLLWTNPQPKGKRGGWGCCHHHWLKRKKKDHFWKIKCWFLKGLAWLSKKLEKSLANTNRTAQKLEPRSRETKMNTSWKLKSFETEKQNTF